MTDVVNPATRSRMMAGIRSKNTTPELIVRSLLHKLGFRFRLHRKDLPGKPDIVLPKYRAVVFINGCFWHGHDCRYFKWPSTREEFWRAKIHRNQHNDEQALRSLTLEGWRVAIVWECALKGKSKYIYSDILSTWIRHGDSITLTISGD